MIKIAFFDTKDYDKEMFDEYNKTFGYQIKYFKENLNVNTAGYAKDFDVVCVFVNDTVDKQVLDILKQEGVKLVALRCAGFNNVDLNNVPDDIRVVRVPRYSPYAIAEFATGLLLCLDRKIYKSYQRTKNYDFSLEGLLGFDINGKTVGVIGTGKIGKVFAKIMTGFGANVIAYDIYEDKKAESEIGYKYVSLDELLKNSDIISMHCPLTKDNVNMINEESISKMKDGVVLINTSRGALVDTKALIKMLSCKKIGAAALDVYQNEGEFFFNDCSESCIRDEELSTLLTMPNVIVTSHQAFFTKEAVSSITQITLQNIKDMFETKQCINELKKI